MSILRAKQNKNEKGFAIMEAVVFLMAFVVMAAYAIDFFTIVHTGIVNTISARAYLFETLQHRSNIRYLRQEDEPPPGQAVSTGESKRDYFAAGERFHAINEEDQPISERNILVTGRRLTHVEGAEPGNFQHNVNDKSRRLDDPNNHTTTVFIKSAYGICVHSRCAGDGG